MKDSIKKAKAKYRNSIKGKLNRKEYLASEEGSAKNKERQRRYLESDKGKASLKRRQERYRKTEKSRIRARNFFKTPKGRALGRARANLRRLIVEQQTPKWADKSKIKEIYLNCPEGYTVDHIVPLKGKNVCGFHVEYNLQYLTKLENSRKNNKF